MSNFFRNQERARRYTTLLVIYFSLAVLATAFAVNLLLYLCYVWLVEPVSMEAWLFSPANLWATLLTFAIILGGSARKLWQLRKGGSALADMLGARQIDPDTTVSEERRLMNIVEEMSIASGIPVPRVYVMNPEKSINAFVAGFRPTETIMVVTRGLMDHLDRDEIQGVVAHEFSHIFNADMRLNMRLMALLAGILAVGKVGKLMITGSLQRSHWRTSRSDKDSPLAILFLVFLGAMLMMIGYIGLFFGRLIKAAISRQRELLADASAIQFTRLPHGLAGALIKIRNGHGSHMVSSHAEDMSHMCFGETLSFNLGNLLATHPPLDERLHAIGPEWPPRARARARKQSANEATMTAHGSTAAFAGPASASVDHATWLQPGTRVSGTVGHITPAHLGYAESIYGSIPESLMRQLHQPHPACLAVYALAMSVSHQSPEEISDDLGLNRLEYDQTLQLKQDIEQLGTRMRLPLLDLCMPALKQLEQEERTAFLSNLEHIIKADRRITLFEFVLQHIAADHLQKRAERNRLSRFYSYRKLPEEIQTLLSFVIYAGGTKGDSATTLFRRISTVVLPESYNILPLSECKLDKLQIALTRLTRMTPVLKAGLIDACADAVMADNKIQVAEAELLRGISAVLDCPMPPLINRLNGQPAK